MSISMSIIQQLIDGSIPYDENEDEHWGISAEFRDNFEILYPFIDEKWVQRTKEKQEENALNGNNESAPQLRIQYIEEDEVFNVYLECYFETVTWEDYHLEPDQIEMSKEEILDMLQTLNCNWYNQWGTLVI